jgi:hypothetical protein
VVTSQPTSPQRPAGRPATPLWIISLFLTLTETVVGIAVTRTTARVQIALTTFVIAFPVGVAFCFFLILWNRPWVFYSPGEYGHTDVARYVVALAQAKFSRTTTRTADLAGEITVVGNPDQFQLLFKAAAPWWQKSTKAMDVDTGCVVQVSSEVLNRDGSVSVAEAVTYVPGVRIEDDPTGHGRHLRLVGV